VKKIAVIGAGGVGSHVAFTLLSRLPPEELVLIDINKGLACGLALDLEDTRGFFDFSTSIKGSSSFNTLKDADIVVITAGISRKPGMSRKDLLKTNAAIVKGLCGQIKRHAPGAIVIVVTNPLDYMTYIVKKVTAFPRSRVMGMGSCLDTSRLLNVVHNLAGVATSNIEGFIYGQHSKDMIVTLSRMRISGQPLETFLAKKKYSAIVKRVQLRGAEIVQNLKTRSACFGPGVATSFLIEAIVNNTHKVIPVSVYLQGEYGLRDVCTGLPCVIGRSGISKIVGMRLSRVERKELQKAKEAFKTCMI